MGKRLPHVPGSALAVDANIKYTVGTRVIKLIIQLYSAPCLPFAHAVQVQQVGVIRFAHGRILQVSDVELVTGLAHQPADLEIMYVAYAGKRVVRPWKGSYSDRFRLAATLLFT